MPDLPMTPEQPVATPLERIEQQLARRPDPRAATPQDRVSFPSTAAADPMPRVATPSTSTLPAKSLLREDVEEALADDRLRALYATLAPQVQGAFRQAADRLAGEIAVMLADGTLDRREIHTAHRGITHWLHLIPRIHRWFLTQEAKVKTDAILALARKEGIPKH